MPNNFQNIPYVFGGGLDTITHPTQTPIGKLVNLENAVFSQGGSLSKRPGYDKLSNSVLGSSGVLTSATATAVFNETDLLLFDTNNIYSWIPSLEKWRSRGTCTAVQVSSTAIQSDSNQQTASDTAILNDIQVIAWNDSSGGVRYSVVDGTTKTQITTNQSLDNAAHMSRCVSYQDYLLIIYSTNDGRILAAIITATGTPQVYTLVSSATPLAPFDVATDGYSLFLATNSAADSGYAKLYAFDNQFNLVNSTVASNNVASCLHLQIVNDNQNVSLTFADSSNLLLINAYTDTSLSTPTTNSMSVPGAVSNVTTIESSADHLDVYFDSDAFSRPRIYYAQFQFSSSAHIDPSILVRSCSLSSHVFTYSDRQYFFAVYPSELQPTYFIINNLGEVVAKATPGVAGPEREGSLSSIITDGYSRFSTSLSKRGVIFTNNNVIFTSVGLIDCELDFNTNYHSMMLNGSLYITGGVLQQYDGNTVTEQGFHVSPESVLLAAGTGGSMEAGTRSYQVTYAWTDNLGKTEESAPSVPQQITVSANGSVTLTIPTLCLTKKDNVIIKVYRTRAATTGDPLMYQVTLPQAPLSNDPDADYVTFIDTLADTAIASNSNLYCQTDTQGFPVSLENIPAPNCTLIAAYKNRIFLAGTDNPNQIWYSKTVVPGEALAFNDSALVLTLNSVGGPITGLAVLDDLLVIFKQNTIFTLTGLGPTNAGTQNDFQDPQQLATSVGCDNANSIVLVSAENGIYFHNSTGLWKLDRQTGVTNAIAVDAFKDQTIVSGDQVPGTTQIRFLCSDGNCIVYDFRWQQWSTFTIRGIDAGVWDNQYYYVKSNGKVYLENNDKYQDDSRNYSLSLTTGQLSFAGLQGYQRMESFLFLGDYIGAHKLKVSLAYDGGAFSETHIIDTTQIFNLGIYGTNNTFGENGVFGGEFYNEQFRIFSKNPVHQRVQIKIEEIDQGSRSAALNMVALMFKVLVRQGFGKLKANRQG